MLTVGLTGGVASGKSTTAGILVGLGARHVDADSIVRRLTERPGDLLDRVRDRFGAGVLTAEGFLDRAEMARVVFGDARARRDLEALIHPRVRQKIDEEIAHARGEGFEGVLLIEAALLVETGRTNVYDRLLVVEGPEPLKLERQVRSGGRSREEAKQRLASQATPSQKLLAADVIVWNDGDLQALRARCQEVWRHLAAALGTGDCGLALAPDGGEDT